MLTIRVEYNKITFKCNPGVFVKTKFRHIPPNEFELHIADIMKETNINDTSIAKDAAYFAEAMYPNILQMMYKTSTIPRILSYTTSDALDILDLIWRLGKYSLINEITLSHSKQQPLLLFVFENMEFVENSIIFNKKKNTTPARVNRINHRRKLSHKNL